MMIVYGVSSCKDPYSRERNRFADVEAKSEMAQDLYTLGKGCQLSGRVNCIPNCLRANGNGSRCHAEQESSFEVQIHQARLEGNSSVVVNIGVRATLGVTSSSYRAVTAYRFGSSSVNILQLLVLVGSINTRHTRGILNTPAEAFPDSQVVEHFAQITIDTT